MSGGATTSAPPASERAAATSFPTTAFLGGRVVLHAGDCLAVLDTLPAASVDAVVTDPPYHFDTIVQRFGKDGAAAAQHGSDGLFRRAAAGFMGKQWDGGDIAFDPATWAKVLRVLKPGGMLAAFSAPKCYHKMAFAIEAAGFEMRDRIVHLYDLSDRELAFLDSLSPAQADAMAAIIAAGDPLGDLLWTFGSGFPKGLDLGKAIDRHLGVQRTVVGCERLSNDIRGGGLLDIAHGEDRPALERDATVATVATSDAAQRWDGWNVALKPAYEPIALARKPLAERSVAAQVLATGTGAINVDGCRVEWADDKDIAAAAAAAAAGFAESRARGTARQSDSIGKESRDGSNRYEPGALSGRWPANITHDGSDVVATAFPDTGGQGGAVTGGEPSANGFSGVVYGEGGTARRAAMSPRGDSGSAARFFYTAKATAEDRLGSGHPTVKPVTLMRWLCRLLTPPGGTILDPFAGTGTTGEAAVMEGFRALLIERETEYQADIERRMSMVLDGKGRRRARAAKVRAERTGAELDHGPLFGTPGDRGGADRSTATSAIRSDGTDHRPDRPQAMNEAAE